MNVQTDRYHWAVPVPMDSRYAFALIIGAFVLLVAAAYYSGVQRQALSVNPKRIFFAVTAAAAARGEGTFWLVWALIGVAAVLAFTSCVIFVGLAATA